MKRTIALLLAVIMTMAVLPFTAFAAGNSVADATPISLGATYTGSITDDNTKDMYKFTLNFSSKININLEASIYRTNYYLYDANGNTVWKRESQYCNNLTNLYALNEDIDLTKGTYYFAVCKNSGTGSYNFKITVTSANESFSETQDGTNNAVATASTIGFSTKYYGQIAVNDATDIYKFALNSSSKININLEASIYRTNYYLYDANGNTVWKRESQYCNNVTNLYTLNEDIDLTKGTYYFAVCKNSGTGNYNFKITAISANESFSETQGGINNSVDTASSIKLGTKYYGQIATNDDKDIYKFTLNSSGEINIAIESYVPKYSCYLYNSSGNTIWDYHLFWGGDSEKSTLEEKFDLESGTYYFAVCKNSTGNYNFSVNCLHKFNNYTCGVCGYTIKHFTITYTAVLWLTQPLLTV